jgi:hypothetical protein
MRPSIESVGNAAPVVLATIVAGVTTLPYDSGPRMLEAKRMTKWNFHLGGTFTGASVSIYGTTDVGTAGWIGYGPTTPPNMNWFLLPAESAQSGTGVEQNPLTLINQSMSYDRPLVAVRVLVTALASGACLVYGFATR